MAVSACAVGLRPELIDEVAVDDLGIEAVLDAFSTTSETPFTANYEIHVNYGNTTTTATVSQRGAEHSVTIGTVRYLVEVGLSRTCDLTSATCTNGLDDTKVSDIQLTHQFWSRATAQRLRIDATRNIAPAESYEAVFAGQVATCASVPVVGGSKVYCSLANGVLAYYGGPDTTIQLTGYTETADDQLFAVGGT